MAGLTATGYERDRLEDLKTQLEDLVRAEWGEMNFAPDSVISQLIGIMAKPLAELHEFLEEVYYSQYPASAEGFSLDNVVALLGLERLATTQTTANVACRGDEGKVITAGAQVAVDGTGEIFTADADTTITKTNAVKGMILFKVGVLSGGTYTITLNGTAYSHTESGGETSYQIANAIKTLITAGGEPVTISLVPVSTGTEFYITADDLKTPFSFSKNLANSYMEVGEIWTDVAFTAVNYGAVIALNGTLTEIVTPISGWYECTNFLDGATGRDEETDAELRTRRAQSLALIGASTVEAIKTQILQNVDSVTACTVYENDTSDADTIVVEFDINFVTGNSIVPRVNGSDMTAVPFNTDQATTMADLASRFESHANIATATVTAAREITILAETSEYVIVNAVTTTGGTSQPEATITGSSRPAHSIEAVIVGGSDANIAAQLWESKPAGIETHGSEAEVITDSMGLAHTMRFTRPSGVEIWLSIVLTYNNEETFPSGGLDEVKTNVLAIGNALTVGEDVILDKFIPAIYQTAGIATASITWALSNSPAGGPYANSGNITIQPSEIAEFAASRIFVSIS